MNNTCILAYLSCLFICFWKEAKWNSKKKNTLFVLHFFISFVFCVWKYSHVLEQLVQYAYCYCYCSLLFCNVSILFLIFTLTRFIMRSSIGLKKYFFSYFTCTSVLFLFCLLDFIIQKKRNNWILIICNNKYLATSYHVIPKINSKCIYKYHSNK